MENIKGKAFEFAENIKRNLFQGHGVVVSVLKKFPTNDVVILVRYVG